MLATFKRLLRAPLSLRATIRAASAVAAADDGETWASFEVDPGLAYYCRDQAVTARPIASASSMSDASTPFPAIPAVGTEVRCEVETESDALDEAESGAESADAAAIDAEDDLQLPTLLLEEDDLESETSVIVPAAEFLLPEVELVDSAEAAPLALPELPTLADLPTLSDLPTLADLPVLSLSPAIPEVVVAVTVAPATPAPAAPAALPVIPTASARPPAPVVQARPKNNKAAKKAAKRAAARQLTEVPADTPEPAAVTVAAVTAPIPAVEPAPTATAPQAMPKFDDNGAWNFTLEPITAE